MGRYIGLTTLEAGGSRPKYLMSLMPTMPSCFVPVSSLHLISRLICGWRR
ncbi:hypothetical protein WDV93_18765 [Pantoea ananatis]